MSSAADDDDDGDAAADAGLRPCPPAPACWDPPPDCIKLNP
ncbi:hypothetical protein SOVF_144630 [Spinacia oleracea]|nr:hypothetical protein SOVF_144630 [Spinacia oleracea]